MNVHLTACVFGVFALDDSGNMLSFSTFPMDPEVVADRMFALQSGKLIPELESLVKTFKSGCIFIVEDRWVAESLRNSIGVEVKVQRPDGVARLFRSRLLRYVEGAGLFVSEEELKEFTYKVSSILARKIVREAGSRRDELLIQAVYCLDDVEEVLNLFSIRVREWYSLNFPELTRVISSHPSFIKIVCEVGPREKVFRGVLEERLGFQPELVESIVSEARRSMGAPILDEDFKPLRDFASITMMLYEFRDSLRSYISKVMEEIAPNLTSIIGPLVGARLIYLAGGLEKLARLPASKIQVLGAEKALFRSLAKGTPPPKHGVIFRHPEVSGAPWWQRGKIARVLANKIAVAVRADVYTGNYIGDALQSDLEKKIKEIKERFSAPPAEKPRRPPRKARKRR
ncbi:MAG: C/D box methylation guide ribonucleoprotein complex aNOP56 subunit [Candidatus Freyarchaeota archaeon]|nr:hypothetical protein [Candidatus Freyrarchaeum guaymaensis]